MTILHNGGVIPICRIRAMYPIKRSLPAISTAPANIRIVWILLKDSGFAWFQDNAPSMGAALAFYSMLSLAPVLIIATAVAGMGFWQKAAVTEALRHIQSVVGETGARVLENAILGAKRPALGAIANAIGIAAMLVGASGAFAELHDALNKIWRVERKSRSVLLGAIRQRLVSFSLVLSTGILLLFSLVSSAALSAVERYMDQLLPWSVLFWGAIDFIFWCGVIALLLAAIFKLLPDTEIAWKDVWLGAAIASMLFTAGKVLIGLYLAGSAVSSTYGAASAPLVILAWISYSAQIFLFGAEITRVYANKYGSRSSAGTATRG